MRRVLWAGAESATDEAGLRNNQAELVTRLTRRTKQTLEWETVSIGSQSAFDHRRSNAAELIPAKNLSKADLA